jgi:hypothetical protein
LNSELCSCQIVGDAKTPLSAMHCSCRQKNKETLNLNYTLHQRYLTDIYRTFHPIAAKLAMFSTAYKTCLSIKLVIGYKTVFTDLRRLKSCEVSLNSIKIEN